MYFFGRALSGQPPSIHYKSFNLNTFISLSVNGLGLFVAELAALSPREAALFVRGRKKNSKLALVGAAPAARDALSNATLGAGSRCWVTVFAQPSPPKNITIPFYILNSLEQ